MKGKLIKENNGYTLFVDGKVFGDTDGHQLKSITNRLSLKNCQAIELGYDLDELFQREIDELMFTGNLEDPSEYRSGMYKGVKIFLELMGDKKFSEDDMKAAYGKGFSKQGIKSFNLLIQSLQQTEWDVEIEMENYEPLYGMGSTPRPKLDDDGCLILKGISK